MRPKDHPELVFDVIPKLYESHSKVFITHLHNVEEQLQRLPKKFCKMYTNRPLANQLLYYLRIRQANISESDFHIVEDAKPFQLRLSDGKRLEVMLCAGNDLQNSLMLLIRRIQGGPLLYYYSAVQQDDLYRMMGNVDYNAWISQGTEILFLNLQNANQTEFFHYDYDKIAESINKYVIDKNSKVLIKLPLFGYEHIIRTLAYTQLYGHIHLIGEFQLTYKLLSSDMLRFEHPDYAETVNVYAVSDWETLVSVTKRLPEFPLAQLKWSPIPTRVNLKQLCSLLRPKHIRGIVGYHAVANVPPAPKYLQMFRSTYSPSGRHHKVDTTQQPQQSHDFRVVKPRKFAYVDDGNDSD